MPAIISASQTPPPKVLVTGGTGYIGPWVIKYLLEDGFRVRAVVRDETSWKTVKLKELFASYLGDTGRLEFYVVEDFLKEDAFGEAVKGVDAVVHLASPLQVGSTAIGPEGGGVDADEYIKPARDGTLGLLKSSTSSPDSTVKRVVYTSSTSAISRYPLTSPHTVFTEEDWGRDPDILEEQGNKASDFVKYRASKTLAERAAWEYHRESNKKDEKEGGGWDLVVLNPPFVLGPNLISALPISAGVQWWFSVVIKDSSSDPSFPTTLRGSCPYVDVRDAARAHVEALKRPEAGGERVIVIEHANSLDNLPPLKASITKEIPDFDRSEVTMMSYNNEKSKRVLGMEYMEYEKTLSSTRISGPRHAVATRRVPIQLSVYRATNFKEHRVAACKVITISDKTSEKERKNVEKEMRVHSALKHKNVLEFLNAIIVELKHRHTYHPGIYILLELAAGGDLFDKIAPDKGVSDDLAHYYFQQVIDGMQYIHSQGVCHRDLKPENLLLDAAGTLKISDFGLSAVYKLKDTGRTRMLTERCGSLPYVAPELANEQPYNAEPVDVWGCGVILFTLLVGSACFPFLFLRFVLEVMSGLLTMDEQMADTPWDEPTIRSPEFVAYVNGTIFKEDPWRRIGEQALGTIFSF
ncbi:hypothetical protein H1R20_g12264, partial [Candolleomyces eurysporus]